nr:site-specific integrase [Slackia exigua]
MDHAAANELVEANPCNLVKAPRPKPKERKALSDEQALELAMALRTEKQTGNTVAVWIALATGMRRGEILGLVWRNVDFDRRRVYVGQQYAADHTIRDPKSEKSHRWLGIDNGTVTFLAEWKARQARDMEVQGLDQSGEIPVCTNSVFQFMDPNTFNRWRRQYFAEHGLGEFGPSVQYTDSQGRKRWRKGAYVGYNLHELRHTQATLLIGSGADIKTVQQRLGHSSASLTMDIYAHFIAQNDRIAANTIRGILGEAAGKPDQPQRPTLDDADRAAIAQRMADGSSLKAAISAVRPDVSVLDLLGL